MLICSIFVLVVLINVFYGFKMDINMNFVESWESDDVNIRAILSAL